MHVKCNRQGCRAGMLCGYQGAGTDDWSGTINAACRIVKRNVELHEFRLRCITRPMTIAHASQPDVLHGLPRCFGCFSSRLAMLRMAADEWVLGQAAFFAMLFLTELIFYFRPLLSVDQLSLMLTYRFPNRHEIEQLVSMPSNVSSLFSHSPATWLVGRGVTCTIWLKLLRPSAGS